MKIPQEAAHINPVKTLTDHVSQTHIYAASDILPPGGKWRPSIHMPKVQGVQEHKPEIRFLPQLRTETGLGAAGTESVRKRSQD